jgi:hypothetical protein
MMTVTIAGICITSSMCELKWWSSIVRIQEPLNTSMLLSLTPFLQLNLIWQLTGDPCMLWYCAFEGGVM